MMLTNLATVLRGAGLTVKEQPDWKTRTCNSTAGVRLEMVEVRGSLWHHTATASSATQVAPTLSYVTNGLGYPLCQLLLDRDGVYHTIAAGYAAHAGAGEHAGLPDGRANPYMIGIEIEGTKGLPMTAKQIEAIKKGGAALRKAYGHSFDIGHYEWAPDRKTDPSEYPGDMPAMRKDIAAAKGDLFPTAAVISPIKKPSVPSGGYLFPILLVDGVRGAVTIKAWQQVFTVLDYYSRTIDGVSSTYTVKAEQSWLTRLGFYTGLIDGKRGSLTINALQRFLKAKGFYTRAVDGINGTYTVKAEQSYLNSQRVYFKK